MSEPILGIKVEFFDNGDLLVSFHKHESVNDAAIPTLFIGMLERAKHSVQAKLTEVKP